MRLPAKTVNLALLSLAAPAWASTGDMRFGDQFAEGGIPLLVILGLSILFLAVTIERLVHLRAGGIVPDGLVERLEPLWEARDFAAIDEVLRTQDSTLARVLRALVAHREQGFAFLGSEAGDIASLELRHHQQKAYALSIVATVAPIVGLLGTVLGMIESFHVIAYAGGMGDPALLAGGISKALVNTAAGLAVALPALGMHHFFRHRMAVLGLRLEKQVNGVLRAWFLPAPAPVTAPMPMAVQGRAEARHAH